MKRTTHPVLLTVLGGILIWFLADTDHLRSAAAEGLSLCARSAIPALFPFLVVTGLLISLGLGEWLSPLLSGLMGPLFRLPGLAGSALLLGLVGGYPIGARTAADLYRRRLLTREEGERLLTFCNNCNPVFPITVLGAGVFASVRTGLWLWLIHVLSALLTGLFFRRHGGSRRQVPAAGTSLRAVSFSGAFVAAVREAAASMLSICAFITLFFVLASPLEALDGPLAPVLCGLLELFTMTSRLPPDRLGFIIASGCVSWGGLSVLCQTAAALEDSGLSLRPYVLGKALQGVLAALLAAALSGYVL